MGVEKWEIPVYAIHSSADKVVPIQPSRDYIRLMNRTGADLQLHEVSRIPHHRTDHFVQPLRAAIPWLSEVWGREPEIREETTGWVFGYMTFAYETLSDEELRSYVDMTATEAGSDLNRALFAGFVAVFLDVSFALGQATA